MLNNTLIQKLVAMIFKKIESLQDCVFEMSLYFLCITFKQYALEKVFPFEEVDHVNISCKDWCILIFTYNSVYTHAYNFWVSVIMCVKLIKRRNR